MDVVDVSVTRAVAVWLNGGGMCSSYDTDGDNHGVPSGPTVTGKWLAQRGPRFDASSAVYIVSSLAGRRH